MKYINPKSILVGATLLTVWTFLIEPKKSSIISSELSSASESGNDHQSGAKGNAAKGNRQRDLNSVQKSISGLNRTEEKASSENKAKTRLDFQYQSELVNYASLKAKVLLDDASRAQMDRLIRNTGMVSSLEALLKSTGEVNGLALQELQDLRNEAIDLLFDARGTSSGPIAEKVLRAVIEDDQIENDKADRGVRQELAGVKAEILYHWSSLEPALSDEIHSWLPGPVSEKIWQNVVEAQNQNELASAETGSGI